MLPYIAVCIVALLALYVAMTAYERTAKIVAAGVKVEGEVDRLTNLVADLQNELNQVRHHVGHGGVRPPHHYRDHWRGGPLN